MCYPFYLAYCTSVPFQTVDKVEPETKPKVRKRLLQLSIKSFWVTNDKVEILHVFPKNNILHIMTCPVYCKSGISRECAFVFENECAQGTDIVG